MYTRTLEGSDGFDGGSSFTVLSSTTGLYGVKISKQLPVFSGSGLRSLILTAALDPLKEQAPLLYLPYYNISRHY